MLHSLITLTFKGVRARREGWVEARRERFRRRESRILPSEQTSPLPTSFLDDPNKIRVEKKEDQGLSIEREFEVNLTSYGESCGRGS